jgi:aminopyrrolnitrin oxygenase
MTTVYEQVKPSKLTQSKTQVDNKGVLNIPASWYIVMLSKDLGTNPIAIELFGRSLVAWRDQNNCPVIMEPYCSHKGASLAIGKVVDGCIQCPFHDWRYDSSGKCVFIPEVEHIPPMARQTTYVTAERYDCIWVWYGSQTPLFSLPEVPAVENERHKYIFRPQVMQYAAPAQVVIENIVDYAHLTSVHKMKFAGPFQFTVLHEQHSEEQGKPPIQKDAWFGYISKVPLYKRGGIIGAINRSLGLSTEFSTLRVDSWPNGFLAKNTMDDKLIYILLSSLTPVTENKTLVTNLIMYRKTGKYLIDKLYAAIIDWRFRASLAEDIAIWNTIKPSVGTVHVKDDWLLLKFRSFYQSWIDKVEY